MADSVSALLDNPNGPCRLAPKEKLLQHRNLGSSILIALALCCLAGSSSAQTPSRYTAGVMLGFGGATSSGPSGSTIDDAYVLGDSFDLGFQLFFGMEVRRGTLFAARFGQLDIELESPSRLALFGAPLASELTYLTLSGEYRLPAGSYQSGLFLGAGYYSIDGKSFFEDDTGLGLTVGVDGDFRLSDRWSVLVEFSGHYADLDYAQFFIMGHAGVAIHF